MARDAVHYIRATDADVTSVSQHSGSINDPPRREVNGADANGNVVALSHVMTTWAPRDILGVGHAISQDIRAVLQTSSHPDCQITWTDGTANIEPACYDLIWVHDRFDLLDETGATSALSQIREGLKAGGQLVVPLGPDVSGLSPDSDLFDQWFSFHRTGSDLTRLAAAAGFAEDGITVRKDPVTGDLLLIARLSDDIASVLP